MAQPVILGRGPFLRVTDQWVSRDQAEMYADSSECTITSLGGSLDLQPICRSSFCVALPTGEVP